MMLPCCYATAQAVVALLDGDITPAQAVAVLMGRGAKGE